MIHLEAVLRQYGAEQRAHDLFGHVLHALAARAHEVVVMLRVARRVRVDVAGPLEPRGPAVRDLRLECAVHSREADPPVGRADPLVQLLRAQRNALARERIGHDGSLTSDPATGAGRHSRGALR